MQDIRPCVLRTLTLALAFSLFGTQALAQSKAIKLLNDWRWEGPSAPLLLANNGYFQKENLAVVLSPATGSGGTVAKVVSGEFDMGLGDFSTLIEHAAKNPSVPAPVAVYIVYERTPSAVCSQVVWRKPAREFGWEKDCRPAV